MKMTVLSRFTEQTTSRYAHLSRNTVKAFAARIGDSIDGDLEIAGDYSLTVEPPSPSRLPMISTHDPLHWFVSIGRPGDFTWSRIDFQSVGD